MITRNITDAVFEEYENTANQLFKNLSVKKIEQTKNVEVYDLISDDETCFMRFILCGDMILIENLSNNFGSCLLRVNHVLSLKKLMGSYSAFDMAKNCVIAAEHDRVCFNSNAAEALIHQEFDKYLNAETTPENLFELELSNPEELERIKIIAKHLLSAAHDASTSHEFIENFESVFKAFSVIERLDLSLVNPDIDEWLYTAGDVLDEGLAISCLLLWKTSDALNKL